jgi:transcriptional regulator with XRE-family HTH domain
MYKADVIRDAMEQQGVSSEQLAELAGVSRMTIWNVLNEKYTPELKTLLGIANALKLPLTAILIEQPEAV